MGEITIPPSPSASDGKTDWRGPKPHEIDPELATVELAKQMLNRMPTPGIVSKPFIVWLGLLRGLQHDPKTNPTYLDTRLLVNLFESVSHDSVNIDGNLHEKFWTFMNKPKMIVTAYPGQPGFGEEEQKHSLWDKVTGWFRGGDKDNGNKPA